MLYLQEICSAVNVNIISDSFVSFFLQCETQLELNIVRPSVTEKMVPSCPLPPFKPLVSPTTLDSRDPMDFLEINYSKTLSKHNTQEQQQIPQLPEGVHLTYNLTMTPRPNDVLEFPSAPQSLDDNAIDNLSKASTRDKTPSRNTKDNSKQISDKSSLNSTLLRFNSSTADASLMPSSVKQLYDVIREQYSDFSFMYALSAQLCQDRVPMDCFVTLKMGLLLSLASIGVSMSEALWLKKNKIILNHFAFLCTAQSRYASHTHNSHWQ